VCASSGETAICICSPGFFGPDCRNRLPIEMTTKPTTTTQFQGCSDFCKNGGTCQITGSIFSCICTSHFTGLTCETPVIESPPLDQCGDLCKNGGTCQIAGPIFSCACTADFTGLTCDTQIALCERAKNPCENGGTCQNDTCVCAAGFTGEFCQNTSK
jgi:hypothetical protein